MSVKDRIKKALGMKKSPTKEDIIRELPKHGQKLPLGGTTVTFTWVGKDKEYIGFSWKRMDGSEGYEELRVFDPDLGQADPRHEVWVRGVMNQKELNAQVAIEIKGQNDQIEKKMKRGKK